MVWIQYQVHPGFNSLGIGTVNAVYHSADLWALFKGDDSGSVRIVPAVTFGCHGNWNDRYAGESAEFGLAAELVPFHVETVALRAHGPGFRRKMAAVLAFHANQLSVLF